MCNVYVGSRGAGMTAWVFLLQSPGFTFPGRNDGGGCVGRLEEPLPTPPSGNRLPGQDYHCETTGLWQFTPLRATSGEDKLILADNADGKQDPAPGQAIAVRSCCGHKLAPCCPCPH